MAAPFGADRAWVRVCLYTLQHHFPNPFGNLPPLSSRKAGGWLSGPARRRTGLSCQPAACCEERWHRMTGFCLFITPRRATLPKLGRLAWFITPRPSDLRFCCVCFWDNPHASRGDARTCYLLTIAAVNYEDGWYHQQCCNACGARRKSVFWVCLVVKPEQLNLAHWARYRKCMG